MLGLPLLRKDLLGMSHGDPARLCYSVPWHPIVYYIFFSPRQKCRLSSSWFLTQQQGLNPRDWLQFAPCAPHAVFTRPVFAISIILNIIAAFKQVASVWFSINLHLLKPSPITYEINIRLRKVWPFMWVIVRLQYSVSPSFEDYWPTKYYLGAGSAKSSCGLWQSTFSKPCRSSSSGSCPAPFPCRCQRPS